MSRPSSEIGEFVRRVGDEHPLLSAAEELALGRLWRERKEPGVRERLILSNLRLVAHVAAFPRYRGAGLDYEDRFAHGVRGLIRALDSWEPGRTRLSTYAAYWIRQTIGRAILDEGSAVRVPSHAVQAVRDAARAARADPGGPKDPGPIVRRALIAMGPVGSLDALGGAGAVAAREPEDAEADASARRSAAVAQLFAALNRREAEVVRRRLGIGCEPAQLSVIAGDHDVSVSAVSQTYKLALAKMRRQARVLELEEAG